MVTQGDYTYHGEHFIMYIIVKSPHYTPETYHVNCTSTKNYIYYVIMRYIYLTKHEIQ